MRRLRRLWIKAIETSIDDTLIRFLVKLRAVSHEQRKAYIVAAHSVVFKYRQAQQAKEFKQEAKQFSIPLRAPKSIKPTKSRKF